MGLDEVSLLFDIVVVVLGRHRSSTMLLLMMLLLLLSSEVKGESREGLFWLLLFEAMLKRRELARKGLLARRGERR